MKSFAVALFALTAYAAHADSGKIIATQNTRAICSATPVTYRKTIIYVDLASIKKDEREWGLTILNRLELAPREWITIIGVNPSTFEIIDVFDSCFPVMTEEILAYRAPGFQLLSGAASQGKRQSVIQIAPSHEAKRLQTTLA